MSQQPENDGQVSDAENLEQVEEIMPSDATAGAPDAESGEVQEGTAGPNAAPRHDPPEDHNESSR